MTKESATSEAGELQEWTSYSLDEYTDATEKLVHHSFKTVNTNAEAGGVRVAQAQGIKLPYIGVRTLMGHGIDVLMDRYEGAATARIYSQIGQVAQGRVENVPEIELSHIRRSLELIKATNLVQSRQISPRVRQILLPRPDGGYLSLTPISAAGVSHQVRGAVLSHNQTIHELRKASDDAALNFRRITMADFPLGGAKHVNPGGMVFSMRSPIYGAFPAVASEFGRAMSVHNSGIRSLHFPKGLQAEYVSWRNGRKGQVETDSSTCTEHAALISRMVKHLLRIGADAYELLKLYETELPEGVLLGSRVKGSDAGLIDPARRTAKWKYDFGSVIARRIAAIENDEARQYEYSQAEINLIAGLVRDSLK
ncbi:hypothetical protein [Pseudomonas sp. PLMAX]|uniref:hypothetical protein n=1 Tax=Pseudomonas sp. PLMAX TaxID=2201998 RepID=UPI0038BBC8E3